MRSKLSYVLTLVAIFCVVAGAFDGGNAIAKKSRKNIWHKIYRTIFGGKPPVPRSPGGSRPPVSDDFCSIVPGPWQLQGPPMFQLKPTWIWRGAVKSLNLQSEGQSIWQKSVNLQPDADGLTRMRYSGPMLEPGKDYRLVIEKRSGVPPVVLVNFRMVDREERSRLVLQLYRVRELAWQAGKRGQALMRERGEVLTQEQLWLDIVEDILLSNVDSTEWRDMQLGIVAEICDQSPRKSVQ
ncbi:hypothetical protein IQ266_24705 [filamentous cyanobacterium LEGE 11480]|uniref:Uncharacterized protein n=1 Tax=Romeriopsis navalis LEGE 11480 TaxID=2777977 RepID=A0A928Z4S8_9CYAN|nr:hypothetical protein [Romeriopsis navalis]MBE9032941.1 hypothetical protein [Romeriopsis navalis LEGE 11480]